MTRSSKAVAGFEPVQTLRSPHGSVQYFRLEGEGSASALDVFADVTVDGGSKDGSYATHVLPKLSLGVTRAALKNGKGVRVTVRVLDAGDAVAGARVAGFPGGTRTTDARGAVTVTTPKSGAAIVASKPGYVSAKGRA